MYKRIWKFFTGHGRPAPPERPRRRELVAARPTDTVLVIHVPPVFARRLRAAADAQDFSSLNSWALAALLDHVGELERRQRKKHTILQAEPQPAR